MRRAAAALAIALAVSGCAPRVAFFRPDASPADHMADTARCEYEIEMNQRGVSVPWWYNNNQALGYTLGAAIGQAMRNDRLRTLCMQAKGYAPMPLANSTPIGEPQPNLPGIVAPVAYAPVASPTRPAGRGDMGSAPPPPVAAATAVAGSLPVESKWLMSAEGVAKASGCATPNAAMTSKGAGMEMFAVACPNGTTLAIRCEVDGCRVLR